MDGWMDRWIDGFNKSRDRVSRVGVVGRIAFFSFFTSAESRCWAFCAAVAMMPMGGPGGGGFIDDLDPLGGSGLITSKHRMKLLQRW